MTEQQLEGLKRVIEYHVEAAKRLLAYAEDADMNKRDSKHYRSRATFHCSLIDDLHAVVHAQKLCRLHQAEECIPCGWPPRK